MPIPPTPDSEFRFCAADIERILTGTFIQRVDYREALDSTNCRAMRLAAESSEGSFPALVLTDRQTAGRGRGTNRWWSTDGSLTFSVLLRPDAIQLPARRWPHTSLVVGLAVCDAIESLFGDLTPRIKWPNDVYLQGRKICGILIEAAEDRLILGVGINVNNSVHHAPPDLQHKMICLGDVMITKPRRIDVLLAILQKLGTRLDRLATGVESLREEWSNRCLLTGRNIELDVHPRRIKGFCLGIDDEGALVLDTEAGVRSCHSGVVLHFD